jgi:fatty acid-binding protein DegV
VIAYAEQQIAACTEYLVIDDLKYLVASGRIGKVKAGFASLLSLNPIVGHGLDGAITHAKVRGIAAAEKEILARTAAHPGHGALLIMVEYTDNRPFAESLRDRFAAALPPDTELILSPLSSASAVHMGPGTFGVAVTRV